MKRVKNELSGAKRRHVVTAAIWLAVSGLRPASSLAGPIDPGGAMTLPSPASEGQSRNAESVGLRLDEALTLPAKAEAIRESKTPQPLAGGGNGVARPLRLRLTQTMGAFPAATPAAAAAAAAAAVADAAAVAAVAAKTDAKGKPFFPLQIPPIQYTVGGNIGYSTQRQKIGAEKSSIQSLNANVNASASSFIWQPWFARVSGGLGLGLSQAKSTGSKTDSTSIAGNGALHLLPLSRFPFEARITRSDSQQSSGLGAAAPSYQSTSFGMTQRYRPVLGNAQYMVSFDRNLWESANSQKDRQDQFRLTTSHQFTDQSLGVDGYSTRNKRSSDNQSTLVNALSARHSYQPATTLSLESLANLTNTNYSLTQGNNGMSYMQLSSSAFWRSADKPLTANGGVRLSDLTSNSGGTSESRSRSANANLGANYELSKQIRLNASGNVNVTESAGSQNVATNQSAGASYQADAIELGSFSYSRHASGNFSNSTDQNGGSQRLSLSPGHGVSRNMGLGGGSLGMHLDQSASMDMDSRIPSTLRLSHNGSLGWNHSQGQKTTTLRLNASDSRTVAGTRDFFQLINLQASFNEGLSRNASWNGNLTMQATRQGISVVSSTATNPALPTTSATNHHSSADLSYRNQRAFNVPRLRFSSELRIYGDALVPMLATPDQQETLSWENRLDYAIGRLQFRLSMRVAEVNKIKQSLLWFSMDRQF